MLKLLLKKQFKELKYSYFKDKKTGKMMNKGKMIGLGSLLGLCYFSLFMAFYGISDLFSSVLAQVNGMWLAFSMFALMTIVLGTFINMFATKAIIYEAKDNELLMSLPIKDKDVVLSRLFVTYFQCLIYTSVVWLPLVVFYAINIKFDVLVLIFQIVILLILTLLTTVLACVFGYLVTLLSKLFKGKSYITTIITIALIGGYYYFYFKVRSYLDILVAHISEVETFIKTKGFVFYCVGKACTGNVLYLLLLLVANLIIAYLCYLIICSNYSKLAKLHIATTAKKFDNKITKQKTVGRALIRRELKHFFSNSTYTINSGLGVVFMVAGIVLLIIFKKEVIEYTSIINQIPIFSDLFPVVIIASILTLISLDCLSVPAVSLEGKNYWIIRTLPVNTYDVLDAKRQLQFKMNVFPAIALIFLLTQLMGIGGYTQILLVFSIIVCTSFISFFDLFLGIKGANLKWTSEIVPIKQASNILIAVFATFIMSVVLIGVYYFVYKKISLDIFLTFLIIICALLIKIIDKWIRTKGVELFENLG